MDRPVIQPILHAIPAARQDDARHYGVHPYFTRRPANVVRAYLEKFSEEGDVVLDPFGGSGVTAIEAMLLGRRAIQNDLNPFANFLAATIADTSLANTTPLKAALQRIEASCAQKIRWIETASQAEVEIFLKTLPLPENIRLPKNSDAKFFYDLFTTRQLAGLAFLKRSIETEREQSVRHLMLLAWSASVAKLNKTFLSAKGRAESRGGSSIFSIYRYKLADSVIELPIWETFVGRVLNCIAAKEEIFQLRDLRGSRTPIKSETNFKTLSEDAAHLSEILGPQSVDYIFTDPPYGAHIAYLDLSILWNHWLGFSVTEEKHRAETIVGGEGNFSEDDYKRKLAGSIRECFRVLKPNRWLSIVFQHWDVSYFTTILETAFTHGGELKSAVTQEGDVIWSMHKKKNSESVLSGEMILSFYFSGKPLSKPHGNGKSIYSFPELFDRVLDESRAQKQTAFTTESLFNRLIIAAWEQNSLSALEIKRDEFSSYLRQRGMNFNPGKNLWSKSGEEIPSELFAQESSASP